MDGTRRPSGKAVRASYVSRLTLALDRPRVPPRKDCFSPGTPRAPQIVGIPIGAVILLYSAGIFMPTPNGGRPIAARRCAMFGATLTLVAFPVGSARESLAGRKTGLGPTGRKTEKEEPSAPPGLLADLAPFAGLRLLPPLPSQSKANLSNKPRKNPPESVPCICSVFVVV
eukprot:g11256.t1